MPAPLLLCLALLAPAHPTRPTAEALPPTGAVAPPDDASLLRRYQGYNSAIQEAHRLMNQREFTGARRSLGPCLAAIPDHAEAHHLLAQMAYEDRQFEACLEHIQITERSLLKLELLRQAEVDAVEARNAALEAALQASLSNLEATGIDPKGCSGGLYTTLQHALSDQEGRLGREDGTPMDAIPAEVHLLHGNCLVRLGRLDEAQDHYQQAIRTEPKGAMAWNNLIGLHLLRKDLPQARTCADQARAEGVAIRPELLTALQK